RNVPTAAYQEKIRWASAPQQNEMSGRAQNVLHAMYLQETMKRHGVFPIARSRLWKIVAHRTNVRQVTVLLKEMCVSRVISSNAFSRSARNPALKRRERNPRV